MSELRRRNVLRMAALYVVAAWLIMQVAEVVIDLANLPDWIGPTVLGLLAVGFPIALVFSWFYELTPEGLSLEVDVARGESITHITGRRMDFIIISLLTAALLYFAFYTWWPSTQVDKSIAVLAFENMSTDPEQEYFAEGISEELLNSLSKIPELRVISRTSAFSFKGKDVPITEIAKQLNVAHVLEGSVRRDGNRVRITAQLIEASSGSHLWSETYEHSYEEVFAIQDEIADAVVTQLKIRLLSKTPRIYEADQEAYALFLQGRYFINQGTEESYQAASKALQQALEIDPRYPDAWAELGRVHMNQIIFGHVEYDEYYPKVIAALETALKLDPEHAESMARLAWIRARFEADFAAAAALYERALALDPGNAFILTYAATLLSKLGRNEQAIELNELAQQRDPLNPTVSQNLSQSYLIGDRLDEAEVMIRRQLLLSPDMLGARTELGRVLLQKGEYEAALLQFEQASSDVVRVAGRAIINHALGNTVEAEAALDTLTGEYGELPVVLSYIYALRGDTEIAVDWMERSVETQGPQGLARLWNAPEFESLSGHPRWEELLERVGVSQEQLAQIRFDVPLAE